MRSGTIVNAVFDSDFLIDYLGGLEVAREAAETYERRYMSIISFVEVLTGAEDADEDDQARAALGGFEIISVTDSIAERAILLRRTRRRLKTPDALIWATAQDLPDCVLVTRNRRDFPADDPGIHVPYRI